MKEFRISAEWRGILKELIGKNVGLYAFPNYKCIINDGEKNIIIVIGGDLAASQNHFNDEVCYAEFKKSIGSDYVLEPGEVEVLKSAKITNIFVAQTIVYFSVLEQDSGWYSEFCVNPNNSIWRSQNQNYVNMVDAGILIEIERKFFCAFSDRNAFRFGHDLDKLLFDRDEINMVYSKTHHFAPV